MKRQSVSLMLLAVLLAGAGLWLDASFDKRGFGGPEPGEAAPTVLLPIQVESRTHDLAPGCFLVARREMGDPNFSKTVILLAAYDEKGAMGLVLNRPTQVSISEVFGDIESARDRKDLIYRGGPVSPTGVLALVRITPKPEGGRQVVNGTYLVSTGSQLEALLKSGIEPDKLRIYAGYAGWGAAQLDFEVTAGAWHVFKADAAAVFDPAPASLWDRFIERTELQFAGKRPQPSLALLAALHPFNGQ